MNQPVDYVNIFILSRLYEVYIRVYVCLCADSRHAISVDRPPNWAENHFFNKMEISAFLITG